MFYNSTTEEGKIRTANYNLALSTEKEMFTKQKRYEELVILFKHTTDKIKYDYAWELKHNIEYHNYIPKIFIQEPIMFDVLQHEIKSHGSYTKYSPDLKFLEKVNKDNMIEKVDNFINEMIKLELEGKRRKKE